MSIEGDWRHTYQSCQSAATFELLMGPPEIEYPDYLFDEMTPSALKERLPSKHLSVSGHQLGTDPSIRATTVAHMHPALQMSYSVPYEMEPRWTSGGLY